MKQFLYIIAAFIVGVVVSAIFFNGTTETKTTTKTEYDTIPFYVPVEKDSVIVRYETHKLPIDTTANFGREDKFLQAKREVDNLTKIDSVDVVIPITQKEYQDSTYHAWVSGYAVNLDSIHTYTRRDIITVEKIIQPKQKHWHLGISAGYSITPKGAQPYIGAGITYSFYSW